MGAILKALSALLRRRWVSHALALASEAVLGALLVVTIYLTLYDVQWLTFLGGVLFAGVVAMASRASRAEWIIARRTRQLERARESAAQEAARARSATEAMRLAEARLKLVADSLPVLLFFVDREGRCLQHNRAVEHKTGLAAQEIDGRPLRELVGETVFEAVAAHLADTLAGRGADYELEWPGVVAGARISYSARHVPYPPDDPHPRGFYLLLTPRAGEPGAAPAPTAGALLVSEEGGEALYLRSITDELMGWGDPRAKLEHALEHDQFLLFAQRIRPLRPGIPDAYEVLLRLREEEDHMLPPGGFFPVAERYGMMEALDRWVVRNLVRWYIARGAARAPGALYCVNLSEATVRDPEFARFVLGEIRRPGFDPRALGFEIAEQEVIHHHDAVERLIGALKPAGCHFTLDGFGAARVSFALLKGLALDFLKIDGAIVQNVAREPAALAQVRAINTVCHRIGVRTIAELVETQATLDRLVQAGVDYVQGFGVARPAPLDALG